MYLHLGNNYVIPEREIMLHLAEKNGQVTAVTNDLPKSFVLCRNGDVYLCQISPSALAGRAEQGLSIQLD